MGRPHTSGSWQKPLPVCHLCLETLQVFALWLGLSGERDTQAVLALLGVALVVAAIPAGCAIGLAWLLAGFLEPKK